MSYNMAISKDLLPLFSGVSKLAKGQSFHKKISKLDALVFGWYSHEVAHFNLTHIAKWRKGQISLLPSVSRPKMIIRQLRKPVQIFEVV